MTRLLLALRSRRNNPQPQPGWAERPAPLHTAPTVEIRALRAADLTTSGRQPAVTATEPAPDEDLVQRAVDAARQRLEVLWPSDRPLAEIEDELRATGISDRTVSLLIAERRAIERIRAAGLDPSVVRADVDDLIRLYR